MSRLEKQDILIIDDDESIRNLLRRALERVGMICGFAADGIDGSQRIREVEYALVLLDLMMPRLDGFGFVKNLREWQQHTGARPVVIIMTAAPERGELTTIGDMVQAVLTKPFDIHDVAGLCHDCVAVRRDYEAANVTPARSA
jgi:CheY-like chemotaxis protein